MSDLLNEEQVKTKTSDNSRLRMNTPRSHVVPSKVAAYKEATTVIARQRSLRR